MKRSRLNRVSKKRAKLIRAVGKDRLEFLMRFDKCAFPGCMNQPTCVHEIAFGSGIRAKARLCGRLRLHAPEHDMKCKACGEPLLIGASGLVCSSAKCTSRIIPARMKEARRKFPAACIEHGDEAEVVTRIQCPECKGKKTVDCDECCGSGDCDCPHCGQDMTTSITTAFASIASGITLSEEA